MENDAAFPFGSRHSNSSFRAPEVDPHPNVNRHLAEDASQKHNYHNTEVQTQHPTHRDKLNHGLGAAFPFGSRHFNSSFRVPDVDSPPHVHRNTVKDANKEHNDQIATQTQQPMIGHDELNHGLGAVFPFGSCHFNSSFRAPDVDPHPQVNRHPTKDASGEHNYHKNEVQTQQPTHHDKLNHGLGAAFPFGSRHFNSSFRAPDVYPPPHVQRHHTEHASQEHNYHQNATQTQQPMTSHVELNLGLGVTFPFESRHYNSSFRAPDTDAPYVHRQPTEDTSREHKGQSAVEIQQPATGHFEVDHGLGATFPFTSKHFNGSIREPDIHPHPYDQKCKAKDASRERNEQTVVEIQQNDTHVVLNHGLRAAFPFGSQHSNSSFPGPDPTSYVHRSPAKDASPGYKDKTVMQTQQPTGHVEPSHSLGTAFPFGSQRSINDGHPVEDATGEYKGVQPVDVYLTWEDLCVIVPDKNDGQRSILQGLTGYAQPGEVLAIMGPTGCGKSTLLHTLAGRLSSGATQTGRVLVNGRRQRLAFGASAYVTRDDILMTTLTVREAVYYSAQLQLPDWMTAEEKKERAEETIREMGLANATDTRIGGWGMEGLSGEQKRKVSICVEILTRPKLLFLDEPTRELDGAASFRVMNRIVGLARHGGMTVLASIHQPNSRTFHLFHSLYLLADGNTIYFGPARMAGDFFAANGFACPSLTNPSDHYLQTINKDLDKVEAEEVLLPGDGTAAQAIQVLTEAYKTHPARRQVESRIEEMCRCEGEVVRKRSGAGWPTQTWVLTKRSFVGMYRDLGYYWLRFAVYVVLCVCLGTIFYRVGNSYGSIQARGTMLMFTATFLTFMAIGGFPSFVEDMKVFGRERVNGHYGVSSFVIANTLSSMPYLALISVVPGAMAYFLVGLQHTIDRFVYFALVLYVCMMVVESLMMIVANIVPDFLMGTIIGAGIQVVMMLNGGFFRLPNDLPDPVWRYPMYYVAFHRYANQGFFKNEFIGCTYPNIVADQPPIDGEQILTNIWQVDANHSKWVDLGVLVGMVVLYRLLFLAIIKTTGRVRPVLRAVRAAKTKKI